MNLRSLSDRKKMVLLGNLSHVFDNWTNRIGLIFAYIKQNHCIFIVQIQSDWEHLLKIIQVSQKFYGYLNSLTDLCGEKSRLRDDLCKKTKE